MEVNEKDLVIWKQKLLEILSFFIKVCAENGLTYYCCGGTALGAVRHHGYIPWDDDIDVIMPRPDFQKFEEIFKKSPSDTFELFSYNNNSKYYYPFDKLCLKNSSLMELDNQPYVEGLYIDIFPVDGCSDDVGEFRGMLRKFQKESWKLEAKAVPFRFFSIVKYVSRKYYSILRPIPYYCIKPFLSRKKIIQKLTRISLKFQYAKSSFVVVYSGSYTYKERIKKEWLGKGKMVKFEHLTVRVPENYDAYLSHIYGEYMKLPPKTQQVGHHFAFYYNLLERFSLGQILNLKKKSNG